MKNKWKILGIKWYLFLHSTNSYAPKRCVEMETMISTKKIKSDQCEHLKKIKTLQNIQNAPNNTFSSSNNIRVCLQKSLWAKLCSKIWTPFLKKMRKQRNRKKDDRTIEKRKRKTDYWNTFFWSESAMTSPGGNQVDGLAPASSVDANKS